jgi:hypothetical protein
MMTIRKGGRMGHWRFTERSELQLEVMTEIEMADELDRRVATLYVTGTSQEFF